MEIRSKVGVHQEAHGPLSLRMELQLLRVSYLSIYLLNGPRGVYGNSYLNTRPPTATHYRLVYQSCSQKRRNSDSNYLRLFSKYVILSNASIKHICIYARAHTHTSVTTEKNAYAKKGKGNDWTAWLLI